MNEDAQLCAACGDAIEESPIATARVEMPQGMLACYFHARCFRASGPDRYLQALYQLAASFVDEMDSRIAREGAQTVISLN